jgi:SAM-dependent methyltransferase
VCWEAVVSADAERSAVRYPDVLDSLRVSYDGRAAWRDQQEKAPWKLAERELFLGRVLGDGGGRLLEIGAGPGHDSAFFAGRGLQVVATDLSPAMAGLCRQKGLDAHVMDFLHLDFPAGSFDAVYALNCLLHVPNADLPGVLAAIRAVLRPGGWFYLGVWGGNGHEGPAMDDRHEPPRFFSLRTDEQIKGFATRYFTMFDFHVIQPGQHRFQSLTMRRPVRRPA